MDVRWPRGAAIVVAFTVACGLGASAQRSLPVHATAAPIASTALLPPPTTPGGLPARDGTGPWLGRLAMSLGADGEADCSTGFAVLTRAGARLLSAAHCDPTGNRAWYDRAGRTLTTGGDDVDVAPAFDSMLIDPVGGTGGYVYGGAWNATPADARYRLAVTGAGDVHVGDRVCTSGANSGEHCGLVVVGRVLVACGHSSSGTCAAWEAVAPAGELAAVGGDSGGPVYRDDGDGTVGARGIVNSGAGRVRCPGTASQSFGHCYGQVFFIGIAGVLRRWDAVVQVAAPGALPAATSRRAPGCSPQDCPSRSATRQDRRLPTCPGLRVTGLGPGTGIRNACAQAAHLLDLFAGNATVRTRDGYLVREGKLGRTGLRLVVSGDLTAARRTLAGDGLVEAVRSVSQGS